MRMFLWPCWGKIFDSESMAELEGGGIDMVGVCLRNCQMRLSKNNLAKMALVTNN